MLLSVAIEGERGISIAALQFVCMCTCWADRHSTRLSYKLVYTSLLPGVCVCVCVCVCVLCVSAGAVFVLVQCLYVCSPCCCLSLLCVCVCGGRFEVFILSPLGWCQR